LRRTLKAVLATLFIVAYISPAAAWLWLCRIDDPTPYILIGGQPVGHANLRVLVEKKTADLLASNVTLEGNGRSVSLPLESLGFVPDVKATIEAVDRIRQRRDDPMEELQVALGLRRGEIGVQVKILLDAAVAEETLLGLKDRLDKPPVNARIGWQEGVAVIDDEPGMILDFYGAIGAIEEEVLFNRRFTVALPFVPVEAEIRSEALSRLSTDVVIAEYTTRFSRGGKDNKRRAYNIELAAGYINGTVLLPGHAVSFNKIVGPRSMMSGFKEAPEIFEGEMVPGIGGGVCQVASTLHAAVFLAALDIIEHSNHSRPSSYIPMGLDATVVWPMVDLKIRNPYPFPVMIRAFVEKNRLTVQVLGAAKPVQVKWWRSILQITPFEDAIEYDESLPVGEIIEEQKGIDGYRIRKTRKLTYQDGTEKTETEVEFYPPTTQMLRMAPGTEYVPVQDRPPEEEQSEEEPTEEAPPEEGSSSP